MNHKLTTRVKTTMPLASAVFTGIAMLACLPQMGGFLVAQFGLSFGDALTLLGIFLSAGGFALGLAAPYLIPVIGALNVLVISIGVAGAAGW